MAKEAGEAAERTRFLVPKGLSNSCRSVTIDKDEGFIGRLESRAMRNINNRKLLINEINYKKRNEYQLLFHSGIHVSMKEGTNHRL